VAVQQDGIGEAQAQRDFVDRCEQLLRRRPVGLGEANVKRRVARREADPQVGAGTFRHVNKQQTLLLRIGIHNERNDLALEFGRHERAAHVVAGVVVLRLSGCLKRLRTSAQDAVIDVARLDTGDIERGAQLLQATPRVIGREKFEQGPRVPRRLQLHALLIQSTAAVRFGSSQSTATTIDG
jgi:hypothetical protein